MNNKQLKQITMEMIDDKMEKTHGRYRIMIFDLIRRRLNRVNNVTPKIPIKREVIVVHYINKGISKIGIENILNNSTVKGKLDKELQTEHTPMISYSLQKTIRNTIFNYHKTIIRTKFDEIENLTCDCERFSETQYYDKHHKHVITGDMSFVQNKRLQMLLEYGPQYRDNNRIDLREAKNEILIGIKKFIMQQASKHHITTTCWTEWKNEIIARIDKKITKLEEEDKVKNHQSNFLNNTTTRRLRKIQEQYILTAADKAQNNVIIACKKHDLQTLQKELDNTPTYSAVLIDQETIQNQIGAYCNEHKIETNDLFPFLYLNHKMHKNPSGARIIAASAHCSTKGLSEIVTIALDKILQIRRKYCQ